LRTANRPMDNGPVTIPIRPEQHRPSLLSKLSRETQRIWQRMQPNKHWLECRRQWHQLGLLHHWLFKPHLPYRAVFVVTSPRSGSNLLIEYLQQLSGVQSLSEVLNWGMTIGPTKCLHFERVIRHIQLSMQTLKTPLRGCKLFLRELENYRLTIDDLERAFPSAFYIVLYRENLAEQYVSQKAAERTRQWILRPGQTRKQITVTIDPTQFKKHCAQMRSGFETILAHPAVGERGTLLTYDALARDPSGCLRELICPLLGVPFAAPQSTLCKQNTEPLSERVTNYAEVEALFRSPTARLQLAPPRHSVNARVA
jgi:LPS sulfotransferase NodH